MKPIIDATSTPIIVALSVASFTLVGCATPADMQPTQAWDQASVTTLSGELVDRVEKAFAAANERNVEPQLTESVDSYLDSLRILGQQCRRLHTELQGGSGYEKTQWTYDEIKQRHRLVRNSPSWLLIEGLVGESQAPVSAVLTQLDGYYGKR